MDNNVFSDMSKVGPGIWFTIHTQALNATTDELKSAFIKNIKFLRNNFRCKSCKDHFSKYLLAHPLTTYKDFYNDKGNNIGYFKWSWKFHNEVNQKLNKPQIPFDQAYSFYSSYHIGMCDTNCGNGKKTTEDDMVTSKDISRLLNLYESTGLVKRINF